MKKLTGGNNPLPPEHTFNFRVKVNYEEGHVQIAGPNKQMPIKPTFANLYNQSNTSIGSIYKVESSQAKIDCVICQKSYDANEFEDHLEIHRNRSKLSPTHSYLPQHSGMTKQQSQSLSLSQHQISRMSEQSSRPNLNYSHHSHQSQTIVSRQSSQNCQQFSVQPCERSSHNNRVSQNQHSRISSSCVSSNSSGCIQYKPLTHIPQYEAPSKPEPEKYGHHHQNSFYSIQEQPTLKHLQKVQSERLSQQQHVDSDSSSDDEFSTKEKVEPLQNLSREELIQIYHSKAGSKHLTQKPLDLYNCFSNATSIEPFSIKQVQSRQIGIKLPQDSKAKESRISSFSGNSSLHSSKIKLPKNYLAQNEFIETNSSTKSRKL